MCNIKLKIKEFFFLNLELQRPIFSLKNEAFDLELGQILGSLRTLAPPTNFFNVFCNIIFLGCSIIYIV